MHDDNPLLDVAHPIAFDAIRVEHVRPAIDVLLADAGQRLAALESDASERTYDNTLGALERVTDRLERAMAIVMHLESVATSPAWREAYNEVQPKVSAFFAGIPTSAGAWRALEAFAVTEEARALDPVRARFLERTRDRFARGGAKLDDAGKARLRALNVELSDACTRFSQNLLDATNAWDLVVEDRARLAGLPDRVVAAARESARERGREGYRFTLQAPSFLPLMTFLDDAKLRERAYRAFHSRASSGAHDNREVVARILSLRREKAALLGYPNFVDLVLADRMAQTALRARSFVEDLDRRCRGSFERENEALARFRREQEGPDAPPLAPWDVAYWAEELRRALHDFDEEQLRPYFPLERVLAGLFELLRRLYGVRVEDAREAPVWHPSVRAYRVSDADGSVLGYAYADLFPRAEKRDGAWMGGFVTGVPVADAWSPHVGVVCANLTPPMGETPALLSHREMETLFHEFGHLLHHLLSRVPIRSLASTHVAWDFVELPSQIMENFCWERDVLDLVGRHHATGASVPEALLDKLRRARTYRSANFMMRQLGFATMDLALHTAYDPARDGDVVAHGRAILQRFSPSPLPDDHAMVTGFGHLFGDPVGYAGGYYSYKWAEVLDADAYGRFRDAGVFSREVGTAFREQILARGDSADPMRLFEAFRGRAPNLSAMLERAGIEAAAASTVA
jgi:oligopeptidase A